MFKGVRASRERNYNESLKETFVEDMINLINFHLNRKKYQSKKVVYFRWHSSGEIYSEEYFKKMIDISNHFKGNEKIKLQVYTKSLPIIEKFNLDDINIKIMYSVVEDTELKNIEKAKSLNLSLFSAVYDPDLKNDGFKCEGDCGKCQVCYKKNDKKLIYVETHGNRCKRKRNGGASRIEGDKQIYFKKKVKQEDMGQAL